MNAGLYGVHQQPQKYVSLEKERRSELVQRPVNAGIKCKVLQ